MANDNLQFETETERLKYARKMAEDQMKRRFKPETIEQLGEAQILSDLEHQLLLSLPAAKSKG